MAGVSVTAGVTGTTVKVGGRVLEGVGSGVTSPDEQATNKIAAMKNT